MAEHNHAEGHCLMHYQCEGCGDLEIIWNSRNGVTPFTVMCRRCGRLMRHINWDTDFYMPNMRMFVDQLPERLKESLRKYVDQEWDKDHGVGKMSERWESKEEAVEAIFKDSWQEGTPALMEILSETAPSR